MALCRGPVGLMALTLLACHGAGALAQGPATPPAGPTAENTAAANTAAKAPTAGDPFAADAERYKIVSGERWRQAIRKWNEWLAVQKTYSPEQVTALRADLNERVAAMSPQELETFLTEMEERLDVLLSPDASEARKWIAQILAVARHPETHFGGPLPDVAHLTASEIRVELIRFQKQRAARQQGQAAFDRARQQQVQTTLDMHNARREASAAAAPRTAATFPEPTIPYRSPYTRSGPPGRAVSGRTIYRIGPWGEPIYWDPLRQWLPWESRW